MSVLLVGVGVQGVGRRRGGGGDDGVAAAQLRRRRGGRGAEAEAESRLAAHHASTAGAAGRAPSTEQHRWLREIYGNIADTVISQIQ